jgi:prepilin peptidase CpaA
MNLDPRMLAPLLLLAGLLAAAVFTDVRSRRIPNRLVLCGLLAGLLLQATVTPGAGLYGAPFGGLGLASGAGGFALGLALLLPMYMLGALGAGDVKLMGMVGSFLGPHAIFGAVLCTLLAGGVLALAWSLAQGSLPQVLRNIKLLVLGSALRLVGGGSARLDAPPAATGKLPYAIAIACGTLGYVALLQTGTWEILS